MTFNPTRFCVCLTAGIVIQMMVCFAITYPNMLKFATMFIFTAVFSSIVHLILSFDH